MLQFCRVTLRSAHYCSLIQCNDVPVIIYTNGILYIVCNSSNRIHFAFKCDIHFVAHGPVESS